ncbi:MAG: hypothetical protein F7B18_01335 [Desulfurococcales archaeon]|nr:hypothetical protein [Desulfurococcales archaeon]
MVYRRLYSSGVEGVWRVRVLVEYDAIHLASLIKSSFGREWFTARDLAGVLYVRPHSSAAILSRLHVMGVVERRKGRKGYLYRLAVEPEELAGAQP